MRSWLAIAVAICGLATAQAWSATMLFDFEADEQVAVWHNEGSATLGADKKLERAERFAASGQHSMRFFTPAWRPEEHGGAQKWPAFECKPPITDWSKFDRLVMSLVNVTEAPQKLMLLISDSKLPTRSGLLHRELLEPMSQAQVVIDLRKGFATRKVDAADIHVMHFFTEDPPIDMTVHLDRLLLLEPGEAAPPLPAGYVRQVATLHSGAIDAVRSSIAESADRMREAAKGTPAILAWVSDTVAGTESRLADLQARVDRGDESALEVPAEIARLRNEVSRLETFVAVELGFEKVRPAVQVAEAGSDVVIGFATSMEKVLPRAGVPSLRTSRRVSLSLAQNEKESLQVIVMPLRRDLESVRVRVSDLRAARGERLAAENVDAIAVGYVETKAVPPYGSSHVGWWPDPILDFMDTVDIAEGDAQAFWVRVRAPKEQPPDRYRGKLEVLIEGRPAFSFDLAVRVYGFAVPDVSPLPLAVTFGPHDHPRPETTEEQAKWRESPDYPLNAWKRHKSEWADFLADYYITIDSLYDYAGWQPAFEDLKRLHDQGRLDTFNLGYFSVLGEGEEAAKKWRADVLERLRQRYERAKELGLLEHAYIYGCDEHPKDKFPAVERAAATLKVEFPDVPVMTTTYDHSFGLESVIKSVDAFCPLTPRFDAGKAAQVRAQGQQVWWYICCGPHHPHANMFIEYPAIEGRLLMGAMTAKYRPDGFLYYQISIWNSEKPIDGGPFTDWDPRSWTTYHGDGSWTCVGPDGTPLPTIRLENFRDGLEDYAYVRVLEDTIAQVEAGDMSAEGRAVWLSDARELLEVPESVAKSMTEYTTDAAAVYRYRRQLAEAIESAPAD